MIRLASLLFAVSIGFGCGGDDGGGEVPPDAAGGADVSTSAVMPSDGANSIDLGTVGVDFLAGTTVDFDYSVAAGIVTFDSFGVTAGPSGAYIRGPLVVLVVGGETHPDPADRFNTVLLQLAPGESGPISPTAVDFAHTSEQILGGASVQLIFNFAEAAPSE